MHMSERNNAKYITKKRALKAFRLSNCDFDCQVSDSKKCIVEEGGCNRYKIFKKAINTNEQ